MDAAVLTEQAHRKRSLLCVGLDPSMESLPGEVWQRGLPAIESYLKEVIQHTCSHAIAYKFNTAFYERWGEAGWALLRRLRNLLPSNVLVIADAKRGDIGHTNKAYAEAFFRELAMDAVTVHPYMGWAALRPFGEWPEKWVFVLLRTTEAPSWQRAVWPHIVDSLPSAWVSQIGWVWGAHHTDELHTLRTLRPSDWLLVPGLGAQGGDIPLRVPLFPALVVVGRSLLQRPETTAEWAARTQHWLPSTELP